MCVGLSAWVGKNDTQVSFPAAAAGLEFFRSSEPDCDPADYASRADGQLDILAAAMVRDTAATLSRPGYYALKHGDAVASLALNAAHFSGRYSYQVVVFKNQFWLIGGFDGSRKNDVWSSRDGVSWIQQTATPLSRVDLATRSWSMSEQLWLIGGSDTLAHYKNDVWRSADGVDWRLGLHHTFRFPAGVVAHCRRGPRQIQNTRILMQGLSKCPRSAASANGWKS